MVKRRQTLWVRAGLWLVAAGLPLCAQPAAMQAQAGVAFAVEQPRAVKERLLSSRLPEKPSLPPAFTIPVEQLGFSAPRPIYLGARNSLASLDFLDEDRLLFTFRVPGLMRREAGDWSDERQIRAVVLALPAGTVEAEALWTVHDRVRYLWMLKDGHFLLRDRDILSQGDATLRLKPVLQFQGPLLWLGMDPAQQFLVTDSREPVAVAPNAGDLSTPLTAAANGPQPAGQPDLVLRVLRRDSGQVLQVSRVRSMVHLTINSDGYLENLRGGSKSWTLNLNYFSGGSRILGQIESTCWPTSEFVSEREVLVTACSGAGANGLVAMSTDGRLLWKDMTSDVEVWPLLVRSPVGSLLARETLAVTHPIDAYSPLDSEDVNGQLVRVFDADDGNVAFEALIRPALDAGGNVAISPSGRRVALLNAGAIQVFDLPAPPSLPNTAVGQPGH
jgi:hypothetical protein